MPLLLAIQIMGLTDADLTQKLVTWRQNQTKDVAETPELADYVHTT